MADVSHVVFPVRRWWTIHDMSLMVWVSSSIFWLIGCMVSEILQFLDFGNLAWKCLLTPLSVGLWGTFPPNNVTHCSNAKGTILALDHDSWAMNREHRQCSSSCYGRWNEKKEIGLRDRTGQVGHKRVIFSPIWSLGEKPQLKRSTLLCSRWRSRRNHVCHVSKWNFQGLRFYRESNFPLSYWFLKRSYKVQRYCPACDLSCTNHYSNDFFANLTFQTGKLSFLLCQNE